MAARGGQPLVPSMERAGPLGKAGTSLWILSIGLWWVGALCAPGKPSALLGGYGFPLAPPLTWVLAGTFPPRSPEAACVGVGLARTCTLWALGVAASSGPSHLQRETIGGLNSGTLCAQPP